MTRRRSSISLSIALFSFSVSKSVADIPRSSPRGSSRNGLPLQPPLPVSSPSLLPATSFLRQTYRVCPGTWEVGEEGSPLGGRHGTSSAYMRAFRDGKRRMMVRQVPGDGNCLFHAVAVALAHGELTSSLTPAPASAEEEHNVTSSSHGDREMRGGAATATSRPRPPSRLSLSTSLSRGTAPRRPHVHPDLRCGNGTGAYDGSLAQLARSLRGAAAGALRLGLDRPRKKFYLQDGERLRIVDLLSIAAEQNGLTGGKNGAESGEEEYCNQMEREGVWGGGPEIVALCHVLKRPIHVYELHVEEELPLDGTNATAAALTSTTMAAKTKKEFVLRRMACFGSPGYDRSHRPQNQSGKSAADCASPSALHILSADPRFPDVEPGRHRTEGSHFLALFPCGAEDDPEGDCICVQWDDAAVKGGAGGKNSDPLDFLLHQRRKQDGDKRRRNRGSAMSAKITRDKQRKIKKASSLPSSRGGTGKEENAANGWFL